MLEFLRGLGLRRRLLTATGAGSLYERIEELERQRLIAEMAASDRSSSSCQAGQIQSQLDYFMDLRSADRLIELEYPVAPRVRYGWEAPPHPGLQALFSASEERYRDHILSFLPYLDTIAAIPQRTVRHDEPHWANDWFPAFDAISLYSLSGH